MWGIVLIYKQRQLRRRKTRTRIKHLYFFCLLVASHSSLGFLCPANYWSIIWKCFKINSSNFWSCLGSILTQFRQFIKFLLYFDPVFDNIWHFASNLPQFRLNLESILLNFCLVLFALVSILLRLASVFSISGQFQVNFCLLCQRFRPPQILLPKKYWKEIEKQRMLKTICSFSIKYGICGTWLNVCPFCPKPN